MRWPTVWEDEDNRGWHRVETILVMAGSMLLLLIAWMCAIGLAPLLYRILPY